MNSARRNLLAWCALVFGTGALFAESVPQSGTLTYATLQDRANAAAALPGSGAHELRILSPTVLEVYVVSERVGHATRPTYCDWLDDEGSALGAYPDLPGIAPPPDTAVPVPDIVDDVVVTVNGSAVAVSDLGLKRNVLAAAVSETTFTMENSLYIELAAALPAGASVAVTDPQANNWPATFTFAGTFDDSRWSPAIHVNQVGYEATIASTTTNTKKAQVGLWMGSQHELAITATAFDLVRTSDDAVVFNGTLASRLDVGFPSPPFGTAAAPVPYQNVYEADFTSYNTAGEYRLVVPGYGSSLPFLIKEGIDGTFSRSFAAGMGHERSNHVHALPYTRHEDGAGHPNAAEVPTSDPQYDFIWNFLDGEGSVAAPADLNFPYVLSGTVDVTGGHMDAGDYSKYTYNSAHTIHSLIFAIDNFGGAKDLDNLGIPESGDGVSDLMQEAKYEADFLLKMLDANPADTEGGFYYAVFPKTRRFEDDVLPSNGDTQVVLPVNTVSTAVATAALAEIASSPTFAAQYPTEAAAYQAAAEKGWAFLITAITTDHDGDTLTYDADGDDDAYQRLYQYGDKFDHLDDLAWAAAAMFVLTGDAQYETRLMNWVPNPNHQATFVFGFEKMGESYGAAFRSYTFGERSGRRVAGDYTAGYLTQAETRVGDGGDDIVSSTANSAYGVALDTGYKIYLNRDYFFPNEEAFDALVAYAMDPAAAGAGDYLEAVRYNLNYAAGSNPVNVPFSTGIGWERQRNIVSGFAENDGAVLPPIGLPFSAFSAAQPLLDNYKTGSGGNLLQASIYSNSGGYIYAFYDRWSDSYNTSTEMTINRLAKATGVTSYLFAQSSLKTQAWTSGTATITGVPALGTVGVPVTVGLSTSLDLTDARVTWEASSVEPCHNSSGYTFTPTLPGVCSIAADILLPDGRRAYAISSLTVQEIVSPTTEAYQTTPSVDDYDVVADYKLDGSFGDARGVLASIDLVPNEGGESFDDTTFIWPDRPNGQALRVNGAGEGAVATIPSAEINRDADFISIEAMVYVQEYPDTSQDLLRLNKGSSSTNLRWGYDASAGSIIGGGFNTVMDASELDPVLTPDAWHHLRMILDGAGYTVFVDGVQVGSRGAGDLTAWNHATDATVTIGNFTGWIDEVVVRAAGLNQDPHVASAGTLVAHYPFTVDGSDATGQQSDVVGAGGAALDCGKACFAAIGDEGSVQIPKADLYDSDKSWGIALETRIKIDAYPGSGASDADLLSLTTASGGALKLFRETADSAAGIHGGSLGEIVNPATLGAALTTGAWHQLKITITQAGYELEVDGANIATVAGVGEITDWTGSGNATLSIGDFDGCIDDIYITRLEPLVLGSRLAHYELGDLTDTEANEPDLTIFGGATLDGALRFGDVGDKARVIIPNAAIYNAATTDAIIVEGRICVNDYMAFDVTPVNLISLVNTADARMLLVQGKFYKNPHVYGGNAGRIVTPFQMKPYMTEDVWHDYKVRLDAAGYKVWVDGTLLTDTPSPGSLALWDGPGNATFVVGNCDGLIDDIAIKREVSGVEETIASYTMDGGSLADTSGNGHPDLTLIGGAATDGVANFDALGDFLSVAIPNIDIFDPGVTSKIQLQARLFIEEDLAGGGTGASLLSLRANWNAQLRLHHDNWDTEPTFWGGNNVLVDPVVLANTLTEGTVHDVLVTIDAGGYAAWVDNVLVSQFAANDLNNWDRNGGAAGNSGDSVLLFGNFRGWIDNVSITTDSN